MLNLSQNECWCVRVYLRLLYVFLSLLMYVYSSREKLKWKHLQIVGKNKHGFNNTKLLLRCISGYKVNNTYSCCWGVFQAAKLAITNHKYLPTGSIYIYILYILYIYIIYIPTCCNIGQKLAPTRPQQYLAVVEEYFGPQN